MKLTCGVTVTFLLVILSGSHSLAKTKSAKNDFYEEEENYESEALISSQDFRAIMGKLLMGVYLTKIAFFLYSLVLQSVSQRMQQSKRLLDH